MCCDTCCYKNMETCLGFAWSKQLGCMTAGKQNRALLGSDRGIGVFEIMGKHAMCNEVSHATVAPRKNYRSVFRFHIPESYFLNCSCDLSTVLLSNYDNNDHDDNDDDLNHDHNHDNHANNHDEGCGGDDDEEAEEM